MASTQLKASLLLELNGQGKLESGLAKFQKQIEQLRDIAKTLGLNELQDGLDQLRSKANTVDALTDGLRGVERQADRTGAAIRRLVQAANENVFRVNSQGGAFSTGSRGALLVIPGSGGGGAGGAGARDAPYGGDPLLLAGPDGGGGIPLNLRPQRGFGLPSLNPLSGLLGAGRGVLGAAKHFGHSASESIGGIFGVATAGFSLIEPMREAAEYDNIIRHIAITTGTVGAAGDKMVVDMKGHFNDLAISTLQTSKNIAESAFYLIQAGLPTGVVDQLTGLAGKVATAYNAQPEDVSKTSFALFENLHVKTADMGGALSSLAVAGKSSHILFPEMAQLFPQIAALGGLNHETGRGGVDRLVAMLAIARKNTATGGEAATNLSRFLTDLLSPFETKHFKALGVDLPGLKANAMKKGLDPLEAVLAKVQHLTHGGKDDQALGKLFHNTEDLQFVSAMLSHLDEYQALLKKVKAASADMLQSDFQEGLKSQDAQLRQTMEFLHQAVTRVGDDFNKALPGVNRFLGWIRNGIGDIDKMFPGAIDLTIQIVGGMVALGAALGAIGLIAGPVAAGWGVLTAVLGAFGAVLDLIFSPIFLIIAAVGLLGLAAYEVHKHWNTIGPFFAGLWDDAKSIFNTFLTWVVDWAKNIGGFIMHGISAGFHDGVNETINLLEHLAPAGSAFERFLDHEKLPQLQPPGGGGGAQTLASGQQQNMGLNISLRAEPGTAITSMQSTNPRVPVVASSAPNAGPVLTRH